MDKTPIIITLSVINFILSIALLVVSWKAYKVFKLRIYKDGFFIISVAAALWLCGHMLFFMGKKYLWLHSVVFTVFMFLLNIGIFKLINAARYTGLGKR
jgi:bacteriorhodopsin